MSAGPPLSAQLADLVGRVVAADFGDWGRADLERVRAELGWLITEDRDGSLVARTELPIAWVYPKTARPEEPGYPSISIGVAESPDPGMATDAFQAVRAAVEAVLGPPQLRGGPEPWLRWRRPTTTVCLTLQTSGRLAEPSAVTRLEMVPTEPFENNEYVIFDNLEWLEPDPAPYLWCRVLHDPATDGMMLPGHHVAEDWTEFEPLLAQTLTSLASDVPILDEVPMTLAIEGPEANLPSETVCCFVNLTDQGLAIESTADPTVDRVPELTALGWLPPSDEWIHALQNEDFDWSSEPAGDAAFSRIFARPFSAEDGRLAARLLTAALRSAGATINELTYWVGRGGNNLGVWLPRLGLPPLGSR
jgi:hypothetical protein